MPANISTAETSSIGPIGASGAQPQVTDAMQTEGNCVTVPIEVGPVNCYQNMKLLSSLVGELSDAILGVIHDALFCAGLGKDCEEERERFTQLLADAIRRGSALDPSPLSETSAAAAAVVFMTHDMSTVTHLVRTDIMATLASDPAAPRTTDAMQQVFWLHSPLVATSLHRFAHILHVRGHGFLAALIMRHAKQLTAVEIHPGAQVEEGLFIDHGVGTVVGGTARLGHDVRLFHGVTLGSSNPVALATAAARASAEGPEVPGVPKRTPPGSAQRHPTIHDGATVYAHAVILGGNTVVGKETVIGAQSFVQDSIVGEEVLVGPRSFIKSSNVGDSAVLHSSAVVNKQMLSPGEGNRHFKTMFSLSYVCGGEGI